MRKIKFYTNTVKPILGCHFLGSNKVVHYMNHIGCAMINMFLSIVVDRGFKLRFGQIKDYKIDIFTSPLIKQH
jgi:hypothetical protein